MKTKCISSILIFHRKINFAYILIKFRSFSDAPRPNPPFPRWVCILKNKETPLMNLTYSCSISSQGLSTPKKNISWTVTQMKTKCDSLWGIISQNQYTHSIAFQFEIKVKMAIQIQKKKCLAFRKVVKYYIHSVSQHLVVLFSSIQVVDPHQKKNVQIS